jgi:hypothetical protein
MFNYSSIPIIVVFCYVVVTALKATNIHSRWYPLISCALGAGCAVCLSFFAPDFVGTTSTTVAIISGGFSGLAATGTDQVFKQLMKAAKDGNITEVDINKKDGQ